MVESSTTISTSSAAPAASKMTTFNQEPSHSTTFIESCTAYHPTGSRSEHDSDYEQDKDEDRDDDDDEALFAELDKELDLMEDQANFDHQGGESSLVGFDMAEFRERRIEELRSEIDAIKASQDGSSYDLSTMQHTSTASMKGLLTELTNEKDLISFSCTERQVAIHFYHPKFSRCALLDRHLTVLARLHPTTLFLKANVLNCPFLTQKLKVSVLPCLITFKDGVSKDKMIGFEELGNSDKFSTGALEWRLGQSGIIDPRENRKPIFGFGANNNDNGGGDTVGRGVVGARNHDEDDFWDDE
ncbi:related to PLP1 - protein involved in actin and tubulin folding [Melanopsichium pennsylvanicum]|uniref:Related to PLP1 - protein involved in actin and tubulin folding n=1 Tax=Melanopsichium pennsylvanicum TaxID=63383 RepID=A0AAJ4XPF4_9BASI|nr:related to PLP1 - protein involved in actin and tubulin folding [Melanopsichium pennsylvanicum]